MQNIALLSILACMVFAVALNLKREDFAYLLQQPKAVLAGLVAQFLLLPWATLYATLWLNLAPAVEAAMILVASCPGGALSNVITHFARGNLALSLSVSAIASLLALVLTPLNFSLLISLNPQTASWAKQLALDQGELMLGLFFMLAVPMALAMFCSARFPDLAAKLRKPLENIALAALLIFVILAVGSQTQSVLEVSKQTLPWVIAHNSLGLALGFIAAWLFRLEEKDKRAVVVEAGMQNSGLALGIIALQFASDPQMVSVAGQWGIWHAVSGGLLAYFWRKPWLARQPIRN